MTTLASPVNSTIVGTLPAAQTIFIGRKTIRFHLLSRVIPGCIAAAGPDPGAQANLQFFGGCYISGNTVLTPPANGTFGNMGRNIFRGPDFVNWDFSVSKNTKLSERVTLQLRGEFFNILNHPNFADVNGELFNGGV